MPDLEVQDPPPVYGERPASLVTNLGDLDVCAIGYPTVGWHNWLVLAEMFNEAGEDIDA